MKNAHGVEPTRYMKRKESKCAIKCRKDDGPIFYDDIMIRDNCNRNNSCIIKNNGTYGYDCNPKYKCSLFVNTNKPDNGNTFYVLDYEVYTHY